MSDLLGEVERNVAEGKTSWIYTLNKAALQRACEHYKISISEETTVDDLRKLLADFTKEQISSDEKSQQSRGEKGFTHESTGTVSSQSVSKQDETIFAMPAIGKLTEFAQGQQSWEDYIEQVEFYLDANNIIEESKKRSTLLTAVGTANYATIKSLCSPEAPKNVSYENILKKCQQHFGKRINELLGRVKFHKRNQGNNETLQEFVSEIRKLALDCKFTGPAGKLPLETMLRDRFVAGIANEELQRYLCRRHEEEHLTRWEKLKTCRQAKTLMKNCRPGRAKELLALSKQKLRVAVGLLTGHSALLRAHLFNLGLAEQKECRLCGDEKENNVHILCHCPALICKRYKTWGRMYLSPQDLESARSNKPGRNWFEALGIRVTGINSITRKEKVRCKESVLEQFASLTLPTLSGHNGPPINIQLKENARPRFIKARRIPYGLQEAASDALKSMVQQGMLRPVDQSEWATPVIFVRKANGKIRVVGDYKITVNPEIMNSEYPLPTVEEALSILNGGVIFSQVDLKDAYKQLRVDEETSKILTIRTPRGLLNVMRLLDGIAAAPCIFKKYMVTIMAGISAGKSPDKRQKINFSSKMEFLGHKISEEGIQTIDDKVKAIKEIPAPKNKRDLQVFLGGVNFYARFIKDRARIAEPLHRLLDDNTEWMWTDKEQKSFDGLKNKLAGSEVLIHFNDALSIVLSADASPHGIGAVLAHEMPDHRERAIAFSSKSLSKTQRHYAQLDREALALVEAVKHFHQFIAGRRFKLITDHKPLYKITLSAYDYELIYRPAKNHGNADLLSRFPLQEEAAEDEKIGDVLMLEGITKNPITPEEIAAETGKNKGLRTIKKWLQTRWPSKIPPELKVFWQKRDELSIINDCITWGARVVVPRALQPEVLNYLHANHPGIVTTKAAPVQAWESLNEPWKRLHVDFAGPFQGQIFLIIVDAYSKWTEVRRKQQIKQKARSQSQEDDGKVYSNLRLIQGGPEEHSPDLVHTSTGSASSPDQVPGKFIVPRNKSAQSPPKDLGHPPKGSASSSDQVPGKNISSRNKGPYPSFEDLGHFPRGSAPWPDQVPGKSIFPRNEGQERQYKHPRRAAEGSASTADDQKITRTSSTGKSPGIVIEGISMEVRTGRRQRQKVKTWCIGIEGGRFSHCAARGNFHENLLERLRRRNAQ
ncbi:uncharacterized protein [Temnothorax nylanderi]|uniref:uncharacterized protein n=1 Tax=Temnothorax nylanderi TaxID=102681 RepID=UPI003A83F274